MSNFTLYRSSKLSFSLNRLTSFDVELLDRLGLRTVIDFRSAGEVLIGGGDRLPYGIEYAHLPVSGGDLEAVYELIASGDHDRQRRELGDGRAASTPRPTLRTEDAAHRGET